jgi:3-hydroxybutyryl-CoA dehydrogenase
MEQGMNMVDIMPGSQTSEKTLDTATKWVRSLGCVPLRVKREILGFCFNRVWRAVKREALHMWGDNYVDFRDIDRAWMIFTGAPWGPFGLMDMVGLDVILDIEKLYYEESGDPNDQPPYALEELVRDGLLGVKTGRGFYTYPDPEYAMDGFITP